MKKLLCLLVCLATLATLCGCNDAHSTFEGFPRPFEASVEGEWNGVTFSAEVKAGAVNGGERQITMTFYAPRALEGTTLSRLEDGRFQWSVGDLELPLTADLSALFELFPERAVPTRVSLNEQGLTVVESDTARFLFLPDDTLYRIEAPQGFLNVTRITYLG